MLLFCRACIWIPNDEMKTYLQYSTESHDHNRQLQGIDDNTKQIIEDLFRNGVKKPRQILHKLIQSGNTQIKTTQIQNFLSKLRAKIPHHTINTISISQIESYTKEKSTKSSNPIDEDTPFVFNSSFDYERKDFKVFWTTNRLLSFINISNSINIDSTFKLNYNGFPVIVVGTTDKNCAFHPFGLSLVTNETWESYFFIFSSLVKFCNTFSPKVLIADSDQSITKGFEECFGSNEYIRVHCWFHTMKAIRDKLKSLPKEIGFEIEDDLNIIQLSTCAEEFYNAIHCFVKKWENQKFASNFIKYFNLEHFQQRSEWYEGAAIGFPSTNNALKSTIKVIKEEFVRNRIVLEQFFKLVENIIQNWSLERNQDFNSAKVSTIFFN